MKVNDRASPVLKGTVNAYVKYYGTANSRIPAAANMMLGKTGVLVFEANVFAANSGEGGSQDITHIRKLEEEQRLMDEKE